MDIDLGDRFEEMTAEPRDAVLDKVAAFRSKPPVLTTTAPVKLASSVDDAVARAMSAVASGDQFKLAAPAKTSPHETATSTRRRAPELPAPVETTGGVPATQTPAAPATPNAPHPSDEDLASMLGNIGMMAGMMSGHGIVGAALLSIVGAGLGHLLGPWSRKVMDSAASGTMPSQEDVTKARAELNQHPELQHVMGAAEAAHPAADAEVANPEDAFDPARHQGTPFGDVIAGLRDSGKMDPEQAAKILKHTGQADVDAFMARHQANRDALGQMLGLDANTVGHKDVATVARFASTLKRVMDKDPSVGQQGGGQQPQPGQQGKQKQQGDPFKDFRGTDLGQSLIARYGTTAVQSTPAQQGERQSLFDWVNRPEMTRHLDAVTGNVPNSVIEHLSNLANTVEKQKTEVTPEHEKALREQFNGWIQENTHPSLTDEHPKFYADRADSAMDTLGTEQGAALTKVRDAWQNLHTAEASNSATDDHRNALYGAMRNAVLSNVDPAHLPQVNYRPIENPTAPDHQVWNATAESAKQAPRPVDHSILRREGNRLVAPIQGIFGDAAKGETPHEDIASTMATLGDQFEGPTRDIIGKIINQKRSQGVDVGAHAHAFVNGETVRDHSLLMQELQSQARPKTPQQRDLLNAYNRAQTGDQSAKDFFESSVNQYAATVKERMKDPHFKPSNGEILASVGAHPTMPSMSEDEWKNIEGSLGEKLKDPNRAAVMTRRFREAFTDPLSQESGQEQASIEAERRQRASAMNAAGVGTYASPEQRHAALARQDARRLRLQTADDLQGLGRGLTPQKASDHVANLVERANQAGMPSVHVDPRVWHALPEQHRNDLQGAYAEHDMSPEHTRFGPHINLTRLGTDPDAMGAASRLRSLAHGPETPEIRQPDAKGKLPKPVPAPAPAPMVASPEQRESFQAREAQRAAAVGALPTPKKTDAPAAAAPVAAAVQSIGMQSAAPKPVMTKKPPFMAGAPPMSAEQQGEWGAANAPPVQAAPMAPDAARGHHWQNTLSFDQRKSALRAAGISGQRLNSHAGQALGDLHPNLQAAVAPHIDAHISGAAKLGRLLSLFEHLFDPGTNEYKLLVV